MKHPLLLHTFPSVPVQDSDRPVRADSSHVSCDYSSVPDGLLLLLYKPRGVFARSALTEREKVQTAVVMVMVIPFYKQADSHSRASFSVSNPLG